MDKKNSRLRRSRRARAKIRELGAHRLCVFRSSKHIYAQLIAPNSAEVLATASTVEKDIVAKLTGASSNIEAAKLVGSLIAERAKSAGIDTVAFDRSGFRYHGRVKALAEAARENGLQF